MVAMTGSHPAIDRQTYPHAARPRTISTDRGTFAALEAEPDGDAAGTVLLVPGYTGSKEDFAPLYDPLAAAGFRVIGLDQRGQYQSEGAPDPSHYTVDALGADLVAVARELDGPAHLVGHSFGGLVARAAVLADASAFASLTLMSSGPAELGDGPRRSMITAAEPHLHTTGLIGIYDMSQQAMQRDPSYVAPPPALATFLRERFTTSSPHALQHMGRAMLTEPDRVAELRAAGVPLLVLYGQHDNAWSPEAQSDMAIRAGAREVVLGGVMHSPALEAPDATVAAMVEFFADVSPSG